MRSSKPAMGKRFRKSEKLDLILLELAKLRGEVKKLLSSPPPARRPTAHENYRSVSMLPTSDIPLFLSRDRAAVADKRVKARPRSARERAEKVPKRTGAGKKPIRDGAPSKPALVQ